MKYTDIKLINICNVINDNSNISVEEISNITKLTNTEVLDNIEKLKEYAIDINVNNNLISSRDYISLMDYKYIRSNLPNKYKLSIFECIDSTSTFLNSINDTQEHICLAEMQTSGRGQFNRSWHSPFAKNIYLSIKKAHKYRAE